MDGKVWAEIEQLRMLKTAGLKQKYRELFGAETHSSNKQFLFRRIAWRVQARSEGDLSERARQRAAELADDAEVRLRAPRDFFATSHIPILAADRPRRRSRDSRLPQPGSVLTRQYHGQQIVVHVEEEGFDFQGRHYRSLSAIARDVTGTRWNGLAFFHLTERVRA